MSTTDQTSAPTGAGLLDGIDLPADVVRTTLDQLTQAVYLYRPMFADDRIVDLEIVYCNRAALALPLTERIVPGALASEVFLDVQDALDVAELAWAGGEPERYDVVRQGVVDGMIRRIRYEISTGRAGDLLVQTSHDHTIDDRLEQSEERLRNVVESLDAAIVLLEPHFDDDLVVRGARPVYANESARALERRLRRGASLSMHAPPLDALRTAWESSEPHRRTIDNLDGEDPTLPELALDLRLSRVGHLLVHVGHDHTARRLAGRDIEVARRRFDTTLDVVGEAVGLFEPVRGADGTVVDFELVHGNGPMVAAFPVGGRMSEVDLLDGDPMRWACDALDDPGEPVLGMLTLSTGPTGSPVTMRVSALASEGQVMMVGADVTEMQEALAEATRSDALLRTILESLAESVRVFDRDGEVVYANQASRDLLGDTASGTTDGADDDVDRPDSGGAGVPYRVMQPSGEPLDRDDWPLMRGQRGERVDDLVVLVDRPLDEDLPARVCRVAVRPIAGADGDARPEAVVVSAHDITESTRHAEQLAWLSSHSRLTGLLNRTGLVDAMTAGGLDGSGPTVVLWAGLSALATIRPTFGTLVGDEAMHATARRIAEVAERHHGVAAQPSDHEFAVVAPGRELLGQALAEEILGVLSEPVSASSVTVLLEPALGIAVATEAGPSADELLRRAQAASWSAELHGADSERWRPDLGAEQMRRVELLGDVQRAIDDREMLLHYQPKFEVATGRFVGAEALVRWHRPNAGWIRPDEFIPALEVSGLARPFTLWAVQRALDDWDRVLAVHPDAKVAVNVPGAMLVDPAFAFAIGLELERRSGVGALVIEITERSVAVDVSSIANAIDRMASIGVPVSIDDFGTGQSSLAYLRHLHPAEVKVDRAFVAGAADGSDPVSRSVLRACIDIGRAAGISVCGEGVETRAELDLLAELGCDVAQGYLLGRPGPIEALLDG